MSSNNFNFNSPAGLQKVDYYGIFREVWAQKALIIILSVAVGLFAFSFNSLTYEAEYETETVFVVTNSGTGNTVYLNLQSAQETAQRFQQVLNSNVLRKAVADEMGLDSFQGEATATHIADTNMMSLKVRAKDPRMAFELMNGILDNYQGVSSKVIGSVVLTVLRAPTVPEAPANPLNPVKPGILAMLLAAVILTALLAFKSLKSDTIRTEYDIRNKLDVNRLATINHEKYAADLSSILITDPTVSFRYVETMQKLARRIMSRMDHQGAKSILITSVLANEGKSTVAANLALAMAQANKRVVLIDCDFRNPSQAKILRMENEDITDLGEYLISGADFNKLPNRIPGSELIAIMNKVAYPNSTELLSSPAFKGILRACTKNADYVVVDSSPMALVADAEEIISEIDASALVIRQGVSEALDINDAADVLRYSTDRMLGCIFNDVILSPGFVKSGGDSYGGYGNYYGSYGYGGHYGQE